MIESSFLEELAVTKLFRNAGSIYCLLCFWKHFLQMSNLPRVTRLTCAGMTEAFKYISLPLCSRGVRTWWIFFPTPLWPAPWFQHCQSSSAETSWLSMFALLSLAMVLQLALIGIFAGSLRQETENWMGCGACTPLCSKGGRGQRDAGKSVWGKLMPLLLGL